MFGRAPVSPKDAVEPYGVATTGTVMVDARGPTHLGCPASSAADGNANQQTRPVMQSGQTAGGSAC